MSGAQNEGLGLLLADIASKLIQVLNRMRDKDEVELTIVDHALTHKNQSTKISHDRPFILNIYFFSVVFEKC